MTANTIDRSVTAGRIASALERIADELERLNDRNEELFFHADDVEVEVVE